MEAGTYEFTFAVQCKGSFLQALLTKHWWQTGSSHQHVLPWHCSCRDKMHLWECPMAQTPLLGKYNVVNVLRCSPANWPWSLLDPHKQVLHKRECADRKKTIQFKLLHGHSNRQKYPIEDQWLWLLTLQSKWSTWNLARLPAEKRHHNAEFQKNQPRPTTSPPQPSLTTWSWVTMSG